MLFAGKYELEERLGEGAMGVVYRARHVLLDLELAVKVLHPQYAVDPVFRARFLREARLPHAFVHKRCVTLRDFGVDEKGTPYLTMDLAAGVPLARLIRDNGGLSVPRAISIAIQVLEVLEEAHAVGILHRDIKPDNIMVDPAAAQDQVKVMDFGIAKIMAGDPTEADLTRGSTIGTPLYMSPEQAAGERLDGRSDIYSMGVVLFEMLTGRPPFTAETVQALLMKHLTQPPPLLPALEGATPMLGEIVARALAKTAEERFATALEFRQALVLSLSGRDGMDATRLDRTVLARAVEGEAGRTSRSRREQPVTSEIRSWQAVSGAPIPASPLAERHEIDEDDTFDSLSMVRPAGETLAPLSEHDSRQGGFGLSLAREAPGMSLERIAPPVSARWPEAGNSPPSPERAGSGDYSEAVAGAQEAAGRHLEEAGDDAEAFESSQERAFFRRGALEGGQAPVSPELGGALEPGRPSAAGRPVPGPENGVGAALAATAFIPFVGGSLAAASLEPLPEEGGDSGGDRPQGDSSGAQVDAGTPLDVRGLAVSAAPEAAIGPGPVAYAAPVGPVLAESPGREAPVPTPEGSADATASMRSSGGFVSSGLEATFAAVPAVPVPWTTSAAPVSSPGPERSGEQPSVVPVSDMSISAGSLEPLSSLEPVAKVENAAPEPAPSPAGVVIGGAAVQSGEVLERKSPRKTRYEEARTQQVGPEELAAFMRAAQGTSIAPLADKNDPPAEQADSPVEKAESPARKAESSGEKGARPALAPASSSRPRPPDAQADGEDDDLSDASSTFRPRRSLAGGVARVTLFLGLLVGALWGGGAYYLSHGGQVPPRARQALARNPDIGRLLAQAPGLEALGPAPASIQPAHRAKVEPTPVPTAVPRAGHKTARPTSGHVAHPTPARPVADSRPLIELGETEVLRYVRTPDILLKAPIPGNKDWARIGADDVYSADGYLITSLHLSEGSNELPLVGHDEQGSSITQRINLVLDTRPPKLQIDNPRENASRAPAPRIMVYGKVEDEHLKELRFHGTPVRLEQNHFRFPFNLKAGQNELVLEAVDQADNLTRVSRVITYQPR